jgi:hypothetical protein
MLFRVLFLLGASLALPAQGSLLYANPAGRGIRLRVVAGAPPSPLALRPEQGYEERFRMAVLALAGPERVGAGSIQVLVERVPPAWRVDGRSGGTLVRIGETTFWRYLPGQVLPVRFVFDRQAWSLQSAELPARTPRP